MKIYEPDSYMILILECIRKNGHAYLRNAAFGGKPKVVWIEDGEKMEMIIPQDTFHRLRSEAWIHFTDHKEGADIFEITPEERRHYYWKRHQVYEDGTWMNVTMNKSD